MSKDVAPFEPGEEVACIKDHPDGDFKKGDKKVILEILQCPVCKRWAVDIGIADPDFCPAIIRLDIVCDDAHGRIYLKRDVKHFYYCHTFFRRLQSYPSAISEILEKFPIPEHSEVDVIKVEEPLNN